MSDSLWPHGLQHARLPCLSPTPRACSHSSPLSQWCHPAISSSVAHFSSCPQPFPASGSFLRCRLIASSGQSIGASVSASVLPMNIQGWFPLGLTGWIPLLSEGLWRVFSGTPVQKHQSFQLSHPYMTPGKAIALTVWTFVVKVMSPHFNMLSRLVITFLPRSKHLYILCLQSPSAVILKAAILKLKEKKKTVFN